MDSKPKPIEIFFHAALMLRFDEVFWLIFNKLLSSGLVKSAQNITICFVGDDIEKFLKVKDRLNQYVNINCVFKSKDVRCYEFPTLQELWRSCQGPKEKHIFYCHTKGVHRDIQYRTNGWLENMLSHMVNDWRNCIDVLSTYDGCGLVRKRRKIFSGNFWWARSSYIKTLPYPATHRDRFQAEYWVAANPNRKSFYLNCPSWPERSAQN